MQPPEVAQPARINPSEQDDCARARLLRAAVEVFDRKGYAAASVREIVERAGVAKPALYYHFGSKEGVLLAILNEATQEFRAAVSRGVEHRGSARDRLVLLCEGLYSLFMQNVPVVRVAHAIYFGPREGAPPFDFAVLDRALDEGIERILPDGIQRGEVRPAMVNDVAMALMGAILACTAQDLHPGVNAAGPAGLGRVLDLVFDGLLVKRDEKENVTQ